MPYPCAPGIPPLPGQAVPTVAPVVPPILPPINIGNIAVTPPDPTVDEHRPEPAPVLLPRFVSEFPLNRAHVLFWLATLCRCSYAPTIAPMLEAVFAVLPSTTPVTFIANGPGLTPGYTIIKLPQGAIVVVSGTSLLSQWGEQIFSNQLHEWVGPAPDLVPYKMSSQSIYTSAANTINTALAGIPNDDQILFVGHSMGGAIAQLLHALQGLAAAPRVPSRCVTFAAPKSGDSRMVRASRVGGQVFRAYIFDTDFVPALPPDLGLFNLAVPAALQPVSAGWAQFRRPDGLYGVGANGSLDSTNEPFLPLQVGQALLAAAAGNPLSFVPAHSLTTYVAAFWNAIVSGTEAAPANWTDPTRLVVVNGNLTAQGL